MMQIISHVAWWKPGYLNRIARRVFPAEILYYADPAQGLITGRCNLGGRDRDLLFNIIMCGRIARSSL